MISEISWTDFQMRFLKTSDFVFVLERETEWVFYTYTGPIIVKSTVLKQEDSDNNSAFVDRYINSSTIVKLAMVNEELTLNIGVIR